MKLNNYKSIGITELSKILGISRTTLNAWKGEMPGKIKGNKKLYDSCDVINWLIQKRIQERTDELSFSNDDGDDNKPSSHAERWQKARADKAEFDMDILKGLYVLKEDADFDFQTAVSHAVKGFQLVGKDIKFKVSIESDPENCQRIIDEKNTAILEKLSEGPIEATEEFEDEDVK